mgnify:CR=1 FL=1|jgi:SAM-dependent methyltransferase
MLVPDLRARVDVDEWMDDFDITDERLTGALENLRWTNRLLGGYRATHAVLDPLLRQRARCRILDLGTGDGAFVARIVRRGARFGCRAEVVGVDANERTARYARASLDRLLPSSLRDRASVEVADARALSLADASVDVAHASLFLHHFFGDGLRCVLREMRRVSRLGLLINDLHRHPLAYAGIVALTRLLPVSPMYRHDAPASVRRGFRRRDLQDLAAAHDLAPVRIRWHWAFRWTLDTLGEAAPAPPDAGTAAGSAAGSITGAVTGADAPAHPNNPTNR